MRKRQISDGQKPPDEEEQENTSVAPVEDSTLLHPLKRPRLTFLNWVRSFFGGYADQHDEVPQKGRLATRLCGNISMDSSTEGSRFSASLAGGQVARNQQEQGGYGAAWGGHMSVASNSEGRHFAASMGGQFAMASGSNNLAANYPGASSPAILDVC